MSDRTALYRHYDINGVLLYVGISLNPFTRLRQHEWGSHWASEIANVAIEYFDTRREADDAETVAIDKENPKYNIAKTELKQKREPEKFRRYKIHPKNIERMKVLEACRGIVPFEFLINATKRDLSTVFVSVGGIDWKWKEICTKNSALVSLVAYGRDEHMQMRESVLGSADISIDIKSGESMKTALQFLRVCFLCHQMEKLPPSTTWMIGEMFKLKGAVDMAQPLSKAFEKSIIYEDNMPLSMAA